MDGLKAHFYVLGFVNDGTSAKTEKIADAGKQDDLPDRCMIACIPQSFEQLAEIGIARRGVIEKPSILLIFNQTGKTQNLRAHTTPPPQQ